MKLTTYFNSFIDNYSNINSLPAWNYFQVITSGDIRYLLKLSDYDKLPELSNRHKNRLSVTFDDIEIQIFSFEVQASKRASNIFDQRKQITSLEAQKLEVDAILNYFMIMGRVDDTLTPHLKRYGIRFDASRDFHGQIDRFRKRNKNLQIKIDEKIFELKNVIGEKKTVTDSALLKSMMYIQKHNGRSIDAKKITVKEWLVLKNDYAEEVERMEALKIKKVKNG